MFCKLDSNDASPSMINGGILAPSAPRARTLFVLRLSRVCCHLTRVGDSIAYRSPWSDGVFLSMPKTLFLDIIEAAGVLMIAWFG